MRPNLAMARTSDVNRHKCAFGRGCRTCRGYVNPTVGSSRCSPGPPNQLGNTTYMSVMSILMAKAPSQASVSDTVATLISNGGSSRVLTNRYPHLLDKSHSFVNKDLNGKEQDFSASTKTFRQKQRKELYSGL